MYFMDETASKVKPFKFSGLAFLFFSGKKWLLLFVSCNRHSCFRFPAVNGSWLDLLTISPNFLVESSGMLVRSFTANLRRCV